MHSELVWKVSTFLCTAIPLVTVIGWAFASVRVFTLVPRKQALLFVIASVSAALVTVELVDNFRAWHVLPAYPTFPSGHEAFTTSFCTSTVIGDRRWLPAAVLVGAIMAPALVWAGFHKWPDVVMSAILSPLMAMAFHRFFRTKVPQWHPVSSKQ